MTDTPTTRTTVLCAIVPLALSAEVAWHVGWISCTGLSISGLLLSLRLLRFTRTTPASPPNATLLDRLNRDESAFRSWLRRFGGGFTS